ncbi:YCF48-related protein [Roseateles aquatilis]|uniref:YCF48-related protein n=1 Tax=Roseateles aquatilis TaxID=431061 RepID=UPI0011308967|nr:YCF48-related protein [Roseateles aquatilis]
MGRLEFARAGWAGVLLSAALLSACGGGGSDSPPPPVQGVAIPDNLAIAAAASTDVTSGTAFTSNVATTAGLTHAWSFGDGTTSTDASPKHDFAKVGDYQVTLKVTNAAGASREVKFTVAVHNRAHVQGLSCTGADSTGWCWQAPRPTGTVQNDFFFLDAAKGWSVGDNGEILRTVDGGKTWVRQPSGLTTRLNTVRFADASNGWILGEFGALLRTTDGGAHWTLQATSTQSITSATLQLDGANTALIAGSGGTRMTIDGGATWTQGNVLSNGVLGADGVLWSLDYQGLRKSVDQGKSVSLAVPVDSQSSSSGLQVLGRTVMFMTNSSTYVPSQGYVYSQALRRSVDNGQTWETIVPQGLPTNAYYGNLDFVDALTAAFSAGGTLYRTVDGGRTWSAVSVPGASNSWYVSYRQPVRGVWLRNYYGTGGYVYELSEDAGATWRAVASDTGDNSLKRFGPQLYVAQAYGGVALLSTDGLRSWTKISGPDAGAAAKTLLSFWFFDAKRGLALSAGGDLMETVNGGLDWKVKIGGLTGNTGYYGYNGGNRFQFLDGKKGWLLSNDGKIYLTEDAGASWLTPPSSASRVGQAFHFIDATNGFALFNDSSRQKQLLMSTVDGGKNWTEQAALDGFYADLKFSSTLKGVLVGDSGRVAVTADGGKTWTGRYAATGAMLRQLAYSEPGSLWMVGDGVLKVSKDDGATWQSAASFPTTASLRAIRFLTPQQGWAVGENGAVLTTVDGGKSWSTQDSGTRRQLTQVFFVDARTGWVAGSDGTLLATGTGGL